MTNGKILKMNTLPIVLFTDASVNWIKKGFWFILCYFLKFNNKAIFDYQNIHLLYESIPKSWTWKDIAVNIKLPEDSDLLIVALELNERLQGKVLYQIKPARNTVKCQANFFARLLWNSIGKLTYYTFIHK